jgi:hypothetical protein
MLDSTQQAAVARIHSAYHQDPIGHGRHGRKYVIGPRTVQVVLTAELFDYSEAAAGVMGYGARPVGIRRTVEDAYATIDKIMSTPESLAEFILTSDRTGPEYCATVRERHAQRQNRVIMANDSRDGFWGKYTKADMTSLRARVKNQQQLIKDYQSMTLQEFEERYELAEAV